MTDANEPSAERETVLRLITTGVHDPRTSEELLPLVYAELRRLAAARLAHDGAAHSLEPTALVHEAYLRLLGPTGGRDIAWNCKAHFFAAAALAMRRILVERARRRRLLGMRADLEAVAGSLDAETGGLSDSEVLDLDEALTELERLHKRKHDVVMARFFAGLSVAETALALDASEPTIKRDWSFARVWLLERIRTGRE